MIEVEVGTGANPWTGCIDQDSERFSFVLIPDRTANADQRLFCHALVCTDLLAPSFAIQLGDLVEGYCEDDETIAGQWAAIDETLSQLRTLLFHTPGNHDVSNPTMLAAWKKRYGRTYYHFCYRGTLFLVLNTQDPPVPPTEGEYDWEGAQEAALSPEQLDYAELVLETNKDARWTVLCMHMPLWQGEHPAWARLHKALAGRPYSAFAGHVHNYRSERDGVSTKVRLAAAGGIWVLPGSEGNFHHITHVTMTDVGPVIANIELGGVRDFSGKIVGTAR